MPFFTFEGIDGSGKSSLLKKFAEHLSTLGYGVEMTLEPGGSNLGLRKILLEVSDLPPSPEAELLLYEADRAQHVATKIRPWLALKKWVLSDRFIDSSVAFQGAGRKLAQDDVKWLNHFATRGLLPDLTVIVDCPVDVCQKRRAKREKDESTEPDRFEREKNDFHQAVRDQYLKMAHTHPRFFFLDGLKRPEALLEELIAECQKRKFL